MHIVFLGGGPSQLPWLEALRALGHELWVVDQNAACVGAEIANRFIAHSIWDGHGIAREIERLSSSPPDLFLTASTGWAPRAIRLAGEALGVRTFGDNAAQAACRKSVFKEQFNAVFGQDFPFAVIGPDEPDWSALRGRFGSNLFLKPDVNRRGKVDCKIVRGVADSGAGHRAFSAHAGPSGHHVAPFEASLNGRVVVEPYFAHGRDLIVLVLVFEGRVRFWAVVEELNPHANGVTNLGFISPPEMTSERCAELRHITDRLIEHFEIVNAPLAISLREVEQGLLPVEMHLDLGGENIYRVPTGWSEAELFSRWLGPRNASIDVSAVGGPVRWSLYGPAATRWRELPESKDVQASEVMASGGRKQVTFALPPHRSQALREQLVSHA